jgi:hypothetical protein
MRKAAELRLHHEMYCWHVRFILNLYLRADKRNRWAGPMIVPRLSELGGENRRNRGGTTVEPSFFWGGGGGMKRHLASGPGLASMPPRTQGATLVSLFLFLFLFRHLFIIYYLL